MVRRLIIAYRGSAYAGWQRQANALAVQQVIEEALEGLLGASVRLHGAGRTDSGVHARGQVAHFELPRRFPERGLVLGANRRLPEDVRILAAEHMPDGFDARRSALGKEYVYRLQVGRVAAPQDAPFVATARRAPDIDAIRRATTALVGRHDFSAFAGRGGSHRHPFRRLYAVTVEPVASQVVFRFVGEAFLKGMVRALVGTLLEIGEHRREEADLRRLLEGGERGDAGPSAPARGLTLERVFYPYRWRPLGGYPARAPGIC